MLERDWPLELAVNTNGGAPIRLAEKAVRCVQNRMLTSLPQKDRDKFMQLLRQFVELNNEVHLHRSGRLFIRSPPFCRANLPLLDGRPCFGALLPSTNPKAAGPGFRCFLRS